MGVLATLGALSGTSERKPLKGIPARNGLTPRSSLPSIRA